jgi:hypothetical protein
VADVLERPHVNWRTLLVNSGETRSQPTYRDDLITVLVCTWTAIGIFLDSYAHSNLTVPETFFTPWHAVFYSGYAATAVWIAWLVWRNLRAGRRGLAAIPAGYGGAVVAVPLFALGGLGDMLWHTFIGIETTINILFSPSHLALMISVVLLMSTPLRRARSSAEDPTRSLAAFLLIAIGTGLATGLTLLFMGYANAINYSSAELVAAISVKSGEGTPPGILAASMLVTNLMLLAPVLLLVQRWKPPFGAVTLVYVPVAVFCGVTVGFGNVSTLLSLLAAGLVIDGLIQVMRPTPANRAMFCTFAGLSSLAIWTIYMAVAMVLETAVPLAEMFTGMPIAQAVLGVALASVLVSFAPSQAPSRKSVDDHAEAPIS